METSAKRSQATPSIASSYSRISGGTPIISVGNPGVSYKSKTESALEKYQAEKAVAEQAKKDAIIAQFGQAGYEGLLEVEQKRIKDIESSITQSRNNEKQGIFTTGAQRLRDEQQKEKNYQAMTRGLEGTLATSKYANKPIY
jgi:hypothetical protein